MKNAQDLQSMLPFLEAIPLKDVMTPVMPVATYIQEAEDLNVWLQGDRGLLESHGQSAEVLDSIPARIGALREAESEWNTTRFQREKVQAEYQTMSIQAFDLFAKFVRHFRYAFRKDATLLQRLPSGTGWATDVDRIQELNDLAVLGRDNADLLEAAGFDLTLLEQLAALSDEVADKCALAREEKAFGRGSKAMRDRAFTYLKVAVDDIRSAGRFLFWEDEARLRGYRSEYLRKINKSRGKTDEVDAETDTDAATVEEEAVSISDEASSAS